MAGIAKVVESTGPSTVLDQRKRALSWDTSSGHRKDIEIKKEEKICHGNGEGEGKRVDTGSNDCGRIGDGGLHGEHVTFVLNDKELNVLNTLGEKMARERVNKGVV